MGTWFGHVAPGIYMLGASLWWLIRSLQEYHRSPGSYRNTAGRASCGCMCRRRCCKRLHIEGFLLVTGATAGVLCEVGAGLINSGYVPQVNIHHLTMYSGFGVAGIIQILLHLKVRFLPRKADYMALIVSLMVMLLLFMFHQHSRQKVDAHLHLLLVFSIAGCILAVSLEMYFEKSIQVTMARSYFFMLQGSWLIDMAFLIYQPIPSFGVMDLAEPENVMVGTLIFAWHMIVCMLVMLFAAGLTFLCCGRKYYKDRYADEAIQMTLLSHSKQNGTHDSRDGGINESYNSLDEYEEDNLFIAPPNWSDNPRLDAEQ